jgi:PIN domain nuclease of toxin-antitoxin system
MKYLLDTHAIIWLFEDSPDMPSKIKEIIKLAKNSVYIHSISLWEIAIKMNLKKLKLNWALDELLFQINNSEFEVLQIEDEYLKNLYSLPYIHKDPFDRLLISSALIEDLTIITIDENIQKYDVPWIW